MAKINSDKEYIQWFKAEVQNTKAFVTLHPTLPISMLYLLGSACGLIHLFILSQAFNLDITKYMEFTDLLMAFLAESSILATILLAMFVFWGVVYLNDKFKIIDVYEKKQTGWRKWLLTYQPYYWLNPLMLTGLILVFVPISYSIRFSQDIVKDIQAGNTTRYDIDVKSAITHNNKTVNHFKGMQFIIESQRYIFVYDTASQTNIVIGRDNLASLALSSESVDNF